MPVTAPSKRPSTARMPSTRSSAATKCISEVPGLEKQTSTPLATSVRTRLSAPFIFVSVIADPQGSVGTILTTECRPRHHRHHGHLHGVLIVGHLTHGGPPCHERLSRNRTPQWQSTSRSWWPAWRWHHSPTPPPMRRRPDRS